MSKSKFGGRREGSANRTVYTQGPPRQLQKSIYGTPKLAASRIDINGIKISRKPDIIGAPRK